MTNREFNLHRKAALKTLAETGDINLARESMVASFSKHEAIKQKRKATRLANEAKKYAWLREQVFPGGLGLGDMLPPGGLGL